MKNRHRGVGATEFQLWGRSTNDSICGLAGCRPLTSAVEQLRGHDQAFWLWFWYSYTANNSFKDLGCTDLDTWFDSFQLRHSNKKAKKKRGPIKVREG